MVDDFYPIIISETYDTAYVGLYYEFQLLVDTMNVDSFSINGAVIPESFSFDEKTFLLTGTPDSIGEFFCAITSSNYDLNYEVDIIEDHIIVVLPTTTIDYPEQIDIKINPNPFSSVLYITIDNDGNDDCYLEVYNTKGIVIDKKTMLTGSSKIDCSRYKNGLYLFKFMDSNKRVLKIEKVIKN